MSEIVSLFGKKLSEIINKSEIASKGFIRLAIKDAGKIDKLNQGTLNYNEFKDIVKNSLADRLQKLNLDNPNGVVDQLEQFLIKQQALFTMAS